MKRLVLALLLLAGPASAAGPRPMLYVPTLAQVFGPSSVPGGVNGMVQYNNAGAFGGVTGITLSSGSLSTVTAEVSASDLGSTTKAFRHLYLYGSGTYGSHSFQFTGTPSANRVVTLPDSNGTVAYSNVATSVTANWAFGGTNIHTVNSVVSLSNGWQFGSSQQTAIGYNTTLTPDGLEIGTDTASNALRIVEKADSSFDFANGPCGTAACTNPHLTIYDKDQNTTNYRSLSLGGLAGRFVTTLVESAATTVATIPIAAEVGISGEYSVTVYATDGSTPQVRRVSVAFAATNDGGTETCTLGTPAEIDHTPTGTLTAAVTCVDGGTNLVAIQVNATSSLSQTTLEAYSHIVLTGAGEILPQ